MTLLSDKNSFKYFLISHQLVESGVPRLINKFRGRGFWLWWHERHDGGFYDMKGGGSCADRGEGFKGLHPGSNGGQYVVSSNANNSVRKSLGPYSIRYTPTGFINQGAPPDEEKVDTQ